MEPYAACADHAAFIAFSRRAPARLATDPANASDRRRLSPPLCRLWHRWGGAHRYRRIAWPSVRRLVFVDADNTGASAYAERRARALGLTASCYGLRVTAAPEAAMASAPGRSDALRPGDLLIGFTAAQCAQAAALLGRGARAQVALLALGERPTAADRHCAACCYQHIDQALALIKRERERYRDV